MAWADLQSRPAWVSLTQSTINLSGFGNDMGAKKIINLAMPTAGIDAATKEYVDGLVTDIAALTAVVDRLSLSPAAGDTRFWNSLRREQAGSGTSLVFWYYIPTAYIVGGVGGTVFSLSGTDYYLPRLIHSTTTVDPTFAFSNGPISGSTPGFKVTLPGSTSTDSGDWRQVLLINIRGVGFVWRSFSSS